MTAVTLSIAHVAAAPAAAPRTRSTARGRLRRLTLDALSHRFDQLESVEWLDDDLANLVQLPPRDIPRIGGGNDGFRHELRMAGDHLTQNGEAVDARHH